MNYTIIKKNQREPRPEISLSKNDFLLSAGFRDFYGVKKYIQFAYNDDGMLCFRLSDDKVPDAYCITKTRANAHFCRTPCVLVLLKFPFGTYSVEKQGDWFVTNCKKKEEE